MRDALEHVKIIPPRPSDAGTFAEPRWTAVVAYADHRTFRPERIPSRPEHRHLDALLRDVHEHLFDSQGRRRDV